MDPQEEKFKKITTAIRDRFSYTNPDRKQIAEQLSGISEEELPAYFIHLWEQWGDGITDIILLLDFERVSKLPFRDWKEIYQKLSGTGKYYCERFIGKYFGINITEDRLQTFTVAKINQETYQPYNERIFFLFVAANNEDHRTLKIHSSEAVNFGPPMEKLKAYSKNLEEQGAFKNHH
jgi:hypothetical protein